ncbi:MAG: hypothetical protein M3268_06355 [Acidobacteriota bacterium]|nr:hypothetical protein [Acidobacteriota bacterium]
MAEIFETHEELGLGAERRARTFTRWVGASVLAHALLLAALVYVPVLRDTFSLANELAGFRVVSKDYKKTEIQERVTLINLAAQKLYYPAGFFDAQSLPSANDPKFIASVAPTPVARPVRVRVKPQPTPSPTPSPAAAEESAKNGDKDAKPGARPSPNASPAQPQTPEEAERIAKEANVEALPEINTKPFEDLLAEAKKKKDEGKIDLSGTFDITAEGDREDDGSISNLTITGNSAANPDVRALANAFVGALADSKVLAALKGTRHLRLKVTLDDKQLSVRVLTETATADEAARLTNGYNMLLLAGAMKKKGKDEEVLFKSVKLNNDARQITLDFQMPRADASALISKLTPKNQTTPSPTPGD